MEIRKQLLNKYGKQNIENLRKTNIEKQVLKKIVRTEQIFTKQKLHLNKGELLNRAKMRSLRIYFAMIDGGKY